MTLCALAAVKSQDVVSLVGEVGGSGRVEREYLLVVSFGVEVLCHPSACSSSQTRGRRIGLLLNTSELPATTRARVKKSSSFSEGERSIRPRPRGDEVGDFGYRGRALAHISRRMRSAARATAVIHVGGIHPSYASESHDVQRQSAIGTPLSTSTRRATRRP